MRYRKLRIAWSVVCAIACLLLIVLWVDSYWSARGFRGRHHLLEVMAHTQRGIVHTYLNTNQTSDMSSEPQVYSLFQTYRPNQSETYLGLERLRPVSFLGFFWVSAQFIYELHIPFWFLTVFAGAAMSLPWIHWSKRFSLRTLLIATTVVAVVLGVIVWM